MAQQNTTAVVDTPQPKVMAGKKGQGRAWMMIVFLVIFQIIAFADKAVLGLVAPFAMPELGLTSTEFGFIGSAFFFLYSIVSIATGILASRYSVHMILLTLGVIWAVMQFPMLLGGGAAVLLITRIILGGAEGPATAMSLTSAHSWFPAEKRALPSNLVATGSTMGPILAAPFLTWVIAMWGWRWAFGALGIIGLVWVVLWLILGGDGPYRRVIKKKSSAQETPGTFESDTKAPANAEQAASALDDQKPVSIWKVLLSAAFLAALLGGFSNFWVQGFLTTWLPQYFATVGGLSLKEIGIFTTFPWILGACLLLAFGWLGQQLMKRGASARIGIALPFGASTLISGLAFLLVPSLSGLAAVLALCVAGGFSLLYPMAANAIGYSVGASQRPIVMATLGGFSAFGAIISPTLVGYLMDKAGYVAPPKGELPSPEMVTAMMDGVHTAFVITGSLLVAGGIAVMLILRPERLGAKLQKAAS